MNWLLFMFMLEIGYLPQGDFLMYDSEILARIYPVRNYFYTDLQVELQFFNFFFVGGGIKTMMFNHPGEGISFFPHSANYNVNAGVRFRGIEIGGQWRCIHPVMTWFGLAGDYKPIWEGYYSEIYLRIGTWRGTDRRW